MSSANQRPGTRLWVAALVAASVCDRRRRVARPERRRRQNHAPSARKLRNTQENNASPRRCRTPFASAADATMPSVVTVMSEVRTRQVRGNGRRRESVQGNAVRRFLQ